MVYNSLKRAQMELTVMRNRRCRHRLEANVFGVAVGLEMQLMVLIELNIWCIK